MENQEEVDDSRLECGCAITPTLRILRHGGCTAEHWISEFLDAIYAEIGKKMEVARELDRTHDLNFEHGRDRAHSR